MAGPEKDKVLLVWDYDSWSNQRWEQTHHCLGIVLDSVRGIIVKEGFTWTAKFAKQSNDFEHESNDQAFSLQIEALSTAVFGGGFPPGNGMFGMGRLEVPVRPSQQISCVPRIGVWSTPILPLDRNAVQNLPAWYTRGTRGLGMMWDDWEKHTFSLEHAKLTDTVGILIHGDSVFWTDSRMSTYW